MKKIVILDFGNGEVYVFNYDENVWEDAENFINELYQEEAISSSASNCQWLIVEDLKINIK